MERGDCRRRGLVVRIMGLASSSLGFLSWRRRITESDFTFHVFFLLYRFGIGGVNSVSLFCC